MAPEVVQAYTGDSFTYDKKCDLWSLGVVLWVVGLIQLWHHNDCGCAGTWCCQEMCHSKDAAVRSVAGNKASIVTSVRIYYWITYKLVVMTSLARWWCNCSTFRKWKYTHDTLLNYTACGKFLWSYLCFIFSFAFSIVMVCIRDYEELHFLTKNVPKPASQYLYDILAALVKYKPKSVFKGS